MSTQFSTPLVSRKCLPCEGGLPKYTRDQAEEQLDSLAGWRLSEDALRIRKEWKMADFPAAIEFFRKVADLAEAEGHHPDLHLEGYRNARIELSTHAIGGLSENDFILAAKIDEIPLRLKK
jgi:4a-hydroxytetrahydrobiopterin dehydratase